METEKRVVGIMWSKWLVNFATVVWIVATYLVLLIACVLMAWNVASEGKHCVFAGALFGVVFATFLHWLLFTFIEHGEIKRLNK